MARALIVGCGRRGAMLGAELQRQGLLVRGTSRRPERVAELEAAGFESVLADPDRPGTILDQVGDISLVIWLLGSATGSGEQLKAIHGPRLERLLEKLVDTPVRGFAYEAAGSVDPELLALGRSTVESAGRTWQIPVALIDGESEAAWAEGASAAVMGLLG